MFALVSTAETLFLLEDKVVFSCNSVQIGLFGKSGLWKIVKSTDTGVFIKVSPETQATVPRQISY